MSCAAVARPRLVKVHVRDAAQQQQQQQRLDGGGECSNEGGGAERFCPSSGLKLDSKGVAVLRKKIAALLGAARANGATKLVLSVRCFAACTPHTRTALHVLPGCVSVWPSLALLRPCVRLALLLCTFFSLLRYSHCNRYRHLLQHTRTVQCFTPDRGLPTCTCTCTIHTALYIHTYTGTWMRRVQKPARARGYAVQRSLAWYGRASTQLMGGWGEGGTKTLT